jgi:hypothetical protein
VGVKPAGERFGEPVQLQVPVDGFADLGGGVRDGADRLDEQEGVHALAAVLALVAVGVGILAVGAGAFDVAVGEEFVDLGIVELLGPFFAEVAFLVDGREELLADLVVQLYEVGLVGAAVDVELDAEALEVGLLAGVVVGGDLLGGGVFLQGRYQGGHAVVIAAADEADLASAGAQETDVGVRGQIGAGDVADVEPTVRIGQCCGDQESFVGHACPF